MRMLVQVAVMRSTSTGCRRVLAECGGHRYSLDPSWLEAAHLDPSSSTDDPTKPPIGSCPAMPGAPAAGAASYTFDLWGLARTAEAHGVPAAVAVAARSFLLGGAEVAARCRGGCAEVMRGPSGDWTLTCLDGMTLDRTATMGYTRRFCWARAVVLSCVRMLVLACSAACGLLGLVSC